MSQWIYRIEPARAAMVVNATDEENAVIEEHIGYQRALEGAGILILAGRTQVDEGTFGVTIFEAPDEETARAVMQTDPAVSAGVMTASLYPYAVGGLRA